MSTTAPDINLDSVVTVQRSLSQHVLVNGLQNALVQKIQAFPNYTELRNSIELTLYCCNAVENLMTTYSPKKSNDKSRKTDKKQMVIDALNQVFSLTPDEQTAIGNHIDFLYDLGKIKKLPVVKYLYRSVGSWVQKKFL